MLIDSIESGLVDQKKLHMFLQYKLGLNVLNINGESMLLNDDGNFIKADEDQK